MLACKYKRDKMFKKKALKPNKYKCGEKIENMRVRGKYKYKGKRKSRALFTLS